MRQLLFFFLLFFFLRQCDSMIISFCARIKYFLSKMQPRLNTECYTYWQSLLSLLGRNLILAWCHILLYVLEYPNYPGPQVQFFSIQFSQLVNHILVHLFVPVQGHPTEKKNCIAQWYIVRSTLISYPSWVAVAVPDTPFGSSPNKACMSSVPCGSWICCWLCTWSSA